MRKRKKRKRRRKTLVCFENMRGYFWALWTENGGNRPELNSGHQKSLFEINVRNLKPFLK